MSTEPKQPHEEELNEAELNQVVGGGSSLNYVVGGISQIPSTDPTGGILLMKQSTDPVPLSTLTPTIVHPKPYLP